MQEPFLFAISYFLFVIPMLISSDKTNHPLLVMEGMGLEVQLLPVTKTQFRQFVRETADVSETDYQALLALNPPVSVEDVMPENREHLFIRGILPQEALAFAQWLGQGFALPTVTEWRQIYRSLRVQPLPLYNLTAEVIIGPAGDIVTALTEQENIDTMLALSLMSQGLVEWVKKEQAWVGLGQPRPSFHHNLWYPLSDTVVPTQPEERLPYFGFRLVRRGDWYLADKGKARFIY